MTIQEALQQRIPRVRQPRWANPDAYLRLPLFANGTYGPWAELYDDRTQEAIGIPPGSQKLCVLLPSIADDKGYESYDGPISSHESENYAKVYVEA